MTKKEYKEVCDLIDARMIMLHDRPIGSNPRWVITSQGASRLKEDIKALVKE